MATATERVMKGEAGEFRWPLGNPISLHGEADAYASERFENTYRRLFYVGCQCGFSVGRGTNKDGHWVQVHSGRGFVLRFSHMTLALVHIEDAKGRKLWTAP